MEDLMGGKLDTSAYLRLINQYTYIYEALEEISRNLRESGNPPDPILSRWKGWIVPPRFTMIFVL